MENVKSSKAEINLLIQQCPGMITFTKPEKILDENINKWKISVSVTVIDKNRI